MNWEVTRTFISEMPSTRSMLSTGRHLFWSNSETVERRDLQYGVHERQKIDIYEPVDVHDQTETILFIHGGGWETGSKDIHKFIGRTWARHNFIVALTNYRLAPEYTYPDQMGDIAAALSWIQDNYDNFTGSLYLAGHSAGAHLASLAGFSDKWRKQAKLKVERILGFILLSGVYQFYPFDKADPRVRRFLGQKSYWEEAQPFNNLKESFPPVFLAHGREDGEVFPKQSIQLSEKLTEMGVKNDLLLMKGAGHMELLLDTTRGDSKFWSSVEDFFGIR